MLKRNVIAAMRGEGRKQPRWKQFAFQKAICLGPDVKQRKPSSCHSCFYSTTLHLATSSLAWLMWYPPQLCDRQLWKIPNIKHILPFGSSPAWTSLHSRAWLTSWCSWGWPYCATSDLLISGRMHWPASTHYHKGTNWTPKKKSNKYQARCINIFFTNTKIMLSFSWNYMELKQSIW